MDTYTYKCPSCGAELKFDPGMKMLVCDNCAQFYSPEMFNESLLSNNVVREYDEELPSEMFESAFHFTKPVKKVENEINEEKFEETISVALSDEYMEINVYHCGSCGAEIMTNDVEVSKFCSFCGQHAIMFDRVSRERKPNKIIPFSIGKDEAIRRAKQKFNDAKLIPKKLENMTIESVYGIYMPYYCYQTKLDMEADITTNSNNQTRVTHKEDSISHDVLLDASKRFNDDVSKCLNPFPWNEAVDYNSSYLSGFYADRGDVDPERRVGDAKEYTKEIITERMLAGVPYVPSKALRRENAEVYERTGEYRFDTTKEKFEIQNCLYVFCPIYFITFQVEKQLAIIMVNGANGKVVGSVPADEEKIRKIRMRDMVINGLAYGLVTAVLFRYMPIWWSGFLILILGAGMIAGGRKSKKEYEDMVQKTNSAAMFDISNNRE